MAIKIYEFTEQDGQKIEVIADGILDAIRKAKPVYPVGVNWRPWIHCGGDCGDCQGCTVQDQAL